MRFIASLVLVLGLTVVLPVWAQDESDPSLDEEATWEEPTDSQEETGNFLSEYRPSGSYRIRSNDDLEKAWLSPAVSLEQRVERTRVAALLLGIRNVDHAARALILNPPPNKRLEAAGYAVRLAPDLPAAHMGLARAIWAEKGILSIGSILSAGFEALRASSQNLYGSLLMGGIMLYVVSVAFVVGALLYILISALWVLPHAIHDTGDTFRVAMPTFARAGLLAFVLLVAPVLGEGWLGLALGGFGLVFCYARTEQRVAVTIAAVFLLLGIHPIAETAGRNLVALGVDPVSQAAYRTEYSAPTEIDVNRLRGIKDKNSLVTRALATHAKREGNLEEAKERYEALLDRDGARDSEILNNIGNVHFAMGDVRGAIEYYNRAVDMEASAASLFNLSQAYGAAIEPALQAQAFEWAQSLDPELIQELMELRPLTKKNIPIHMPVRVKMIRDRLLEQADGEDIGRVFRGSIAPGHLSSMFISVIAFALVAVISGVLSKFFEWSFWCQSCHRSCCPQCEGAAVDKNLCDTCDILYNRPESTDKALREKRVAELKKKDQVYNQVRLGLTIVVPGVGGLIAQRFMHALLSCFLFSGAVIGLFGVSQVVPDPMVTGGAEVFLLLVASSVLLVMYGLALLVSVRLCRSR